MQTTKTTACLLLAAMVAAGPALATPPAAGHGMPAGGKDLLVSEKAPRPSELPNVGTVVSSIDANDFTYVEVSRDKAKETEWLAVQKQEFKVGSIIRYEDGSVMTNFYSKLLKRTFASVRFVDYVLITPKP